MADESLKDIGINLSNEFQALLCNYTSGWLTDNLLSSEDWEEIALLYQETERFEGVINESKVWEKLLTTGFIPPDLGSSNNINLGEETTSDDRPKIHPYLETWRRYESLVNPHRRIPTANSQSSYAKRRSASLSLGDTASKPQVISQRVVAPGEGQKNHPVLGNYSDSVAEIPLVDTRINPRDLDFDESDAEGGDRVLSQELAFSKSDSDPTSEFLPVVDEPREIKTQFAKNVNLPNLDKATEKTEHIQRNFAQNSLGMKGLKDLSAFLVSQPNQEHIIEADLLSKSSSENLLFSESELADYQMETSEKISYFSDVSEEFLAAKGGWLEPQESEVENRTKIADRSRNRYAMVEPSLHSDRHPELEMETILEAIAQEINREYRRFYGE
jgi:predicted Rdx family selenoprotein